MDASNNSLDFALGLHGRDDNVSKPRSVKEATVHICLCLWTSKLTVAVESTVDKQQDTRYGEGEIHEDRETKVSSRVHQSSAFPKMVEGSHAPWEP